MTYIAKPEVRHPSLKTNARGLTRRDYEGSMSTLCAGCGHDSVTAAIIEACYEMSLDPHRVVKLSGIGCSSKTPAYFLKQAHGFNSVHGRMPSIAQGANAANRDLVYVGISGDGDSLSIGLGQLCHAARRNVNMVYIIENNGVYGLTKGQFSASADVETKSKKGAPNSWSPIDPSVLALGVGASFVARGFSGDKAQLIPVLKAAIAHPGFALVDVISPCVTFNDHVGSTKSYLYTRQHYDEVVRANFVPVHDRENGQDDQTRAVVLPDGSRIRFEKLPAGYQPTDRQAAMNLLFEKAKADVVMTGLLFVDPVSREFHTVSGTTSTPLVQLPFSELCPGSEALSELMEEFR